jgi:outer membrane protease
MDRSLLLDSMAKRLRKAADSSNWRELKLADRELAQKLLPAAARWSAWTARERTAYAGLRQTHVEVRQHCRREADLYATRIAGMRETKIGWTAYSMHGSAMAGYSMHGVATERNSTQGAAAVAYSTSGAATIGDSRRGATMVRKSTSGAATGGKS